MLVCFRVRFRRVHGAVGMFRRSVESVKPHRFGAGIDYVVAGAGRYEDGIVPHQQLRALGAATPGCHPANLPT